MTTAAYKLVDREGYSRRNESGETCWLPVGTIVSPTGEGTGPCGPGVLHAYCSPEVAVLGNPIHARIQDPRCLRVEIVDGGVWQTDGLKRWTTAPLRVLEEVPLPTLSMTELIAWAIVLAPHASTRRWAIRWLSGEDRTVAEARAAEKAAKAAQRSGMWTREVVAEAWTATEAAWVASLAASVDHQATWVCAARAGEVTKVERNLMPALIRARAILASKSPAERYDEPIEEEGK